ncbi:MAG: hypothetical protein H7Y88_04025 [Phycisphaerales bacterium]|nr:hypothetical protein [Phycisphaerales bacterium]
MTPLRCLRRVLALVVCGCAVLTGRAEVETLTLLTSRGDHTGLALDAIVYLIAGDEDCLVTLDYANPGVAIDAIELSACFLADGALVPDASARTSASPAALRAPDGFLEVAFGLEPVGAGTWSARVTIDYADGTTTVLLFGL